MVAFDVGGSGPAAARVESARTATERRMVIFGGMFCGWGGGGDEKGGCMSDLLTTKLFVEKGSVKNVGDEVRRMSAGYQTC